MFSSEGTCDWCKKPSALTKLNYIDGKSNNSCEDCYDLASLDVREFNIAERQHQEQHCAQY
ncbi:MULTISPECIES: hypothetical protein [Vibrio]|uniref:Uncharacterized protein n=2 Tax=Vibrio genomosp. F10 TaxID=723171 RepID=A0A1B9QTB6_9VIBR|nr:MULTISPECIES: hypothetical protein [Vibrio]OCH69347.1 hypothetical protein A6E14_16380 [Vibrio genomosp. F10]OEE32622.1 hypothetical protein A1QO_01535 [Vibrio genomosp. F10 str. ZF-129]OEE88338.1 hypothetical protein A1QK_03515 [Vibrio genomosp. F10 str. 9ZD137]OEE96550.1 hypothetical protein A1QM_16755 [Vibrio genomosp. F10 str. 9ZC157]OEF07654.1 hypothetical protein A1QI_05210 [Vibrio genomosp. F10 str. 9ZB36]